MIPEDVTTIIRVQADWNSWRTAEVRLCDLEDIHWFRPSNAPQPLLFCHVPCDRLFNGEIPHGCGSKGWPHRLLVCVLRKHTVRSAYIELVRRSYMEMGHWPTAHRTAIQRWHAIAR